MEVLVALARASGQVVTRDELIDLCWAGRIVTDDAINRVVSRIRQVGAGANFTIETITKVGYRLVPNTGLHAVQTPVQLPAAKAAEWPSRRTLIAGGAATAVVLAGAIVWRFPSRHSPPAEAVDLYRRGDLAQRIGIASQARQAVSYLEQAVQIDPDYAAAWGALALAQTHTLDGFSEGELASLAGRIQSAAGRALDLDPDNADALLALVSVKPFYRNWAASEARLRELVQRFPGHWLCHGRLAMVLRQVGRVDEAIVHQKRVIAIDPMIPPAYGFTVGALSIAGRIQEADALLKLALDRWPAHPMLWFTKYTHLLTTGRPRSAAAFVTEPENLPSGVGPADVQPLLVLAKAVDTGEPKDVQSAVESQVQLIQRDPGAIGDAVQALALLGRLDLTFAGLERYLLNAGTFGAPLPLGPHPRRYTDLLFTRPMASARQDRRFSALTSRIGLEDYWRSTGTQPDYRRSGYQPQV
ncbi:tetratricopeptide (TPR) repeat protein [Sphingomonas sp. F9_3S_D5_B_2]